MAEENSPKHSIISILAIIIPITLAIIGGVSFILFNIYSLKSEVAELNNKINKSYLPSDRTMLMVVKLKNKDILELRNPVIDAAYQRSSDKYIIKSDSFSKSEEVLKPYILFFEPEFILVADIIGPYIEKITTLSTNSRNIF